MIPLSSWGSLSLLVMALGITVTTNNSWAAGTDPNGYLDEVSSKNFNLLYDMAVKLESPKTMSEEFSQSLAGQLYRFFRPSKLAQVRFMNSKTMKVADEFRRKAYEFCRPKSMVSGLFDWGTAKHLSLIASGEPELVEIAERYDKDKSKVTAKVIDCDISKYLFRQTSKIVLLLQAEIKHIIIQKQAISNKAIYDELKAHDYTSHSNFYNMKNPLSPKKVEAMRNFYNSRFDVEKTNVQEALDHFKAPTELVMGRLRETCSALIQFQITLVDHERYTNKWCSTWTDPFKDENLANKQREYIQLCNHLLAI